MVDQARAKGRSVGIYGPLTLRVPDTREEEWTGKAVAAYRSLNSAEASAPTPTGSSSGSTWEPANTYDEPPF